MSDQHKCYDSASAARLVYREVETNGAANLNCLAGTNVDLYIDGVFDSAIGWPGIVNLQNSASLMAGETPCIGVAGIGYFDGVLDEIKLFAGDTLGSIEWDSSRGWPPLQYYNVQNPTTPWTNGLLVDSTNAAKLAYNYMEADGSANLNGAQGAVRFWFNPDWNGGTGTGAPGYLFELGDVYSPGGGWALETDSSGSGLSFVSGSNGMLTTYLAAGIGGWVSNTWHQVVLSYSATNTQLFLDGAPAAGGPGLAFEPELATRLADGFAVGSDCNGSGQAGGVFDELATFNCPLTQSDVTANYPYPAIWAQPASVTVKNGSTAFFSVAAGSGTALAYQWQTNGVALTDSDRITGTTSNVLSIADVDDPDGRAGSPMTDIKYSVVLSNSAGTITSAVVVLAVNDMAQLGSWNFATTNWTGQQGQLPLLAANVTAQAAWSTNGVKVDSTNAARLVYRDVETNGAANLNCRVGSVVLWFKPDWSSQSAGGNGPQVDGRFIELGGYGPTNTASNWWALLLSSDGNSLSFCTEANGALTTNVTNSISWTSNTWHQIVLVYSSTSSGFYVDCQNGYSSGWGSGVAYWPCRAVRDQGICVGSDASGTQQIRGVLADLETYNYRLDSSSGYIPGSFGAVETGGGDYDICFATRYTSNAAVAAAIAGPPSESMQILVNSNSLGSSNWIPFNANPTVNLGTNDGLKTVNFYFNSLSNIVSSYSLRLWLDTTPPAITITSPGPGTNTVNQPILQLQGYAPEELAGVTYDLTNSAGWLTNQPAVVLSRCYDTNQGWFTTNTFQAFDLDLTLGANQITLHAKDLAGNVTTTNLTYTLDYSSKTNPPVLALYWPTNGALICGTNFTWRGWVDDSTVTLSAQIVDTNGDTNVLYGIVERNGNFWVDNMPLASGTNWMTVTAVDAVGNTSSNNITVVQSAVNMTFTSIPDITNQTTVTVTGTLDTSDYAVWVNGVQAAFAPNGTDWTAGNVPVNGAGTAVFEALAIPTSDNGGYGTNNGGGGTNSSLQNPGNPTPGEACAVLQVAPDKLPAIICTKYSLTTDILWTDTGGATNDTLASEYWALGSPGYASSSSWVGYIIDNNQGDGSTAFNATCHVWNQFGYGSTTNYNSVTDNDITHPTSNLSTMDMTGGGFTPEESDYDDSTAGWTSADFLTTYYPDPAVFTSKRNVASSYSLQTGGKAASYQEAVFGLHVTAQNITHLGAPGFSSVPVSYTQMTVMGQHLDSNCNLSVPEPDGVMVPIPVAVPGSSSFIYAFSQPLQTSGLGTWNIFADTVDLNRHGVDPTATDENGFTAIYFPSAGWSPKGQIVLYQIVSVDLAELPKVDTTLRLDHGAHPTNMACPLPPAMSLDKPHVPYSYQDSPVSPNWLFKFTAVAVDRSSACQDVQLLSTFYFEFDSKTRRVTNRDGTKKDHFKTGMERWWSGDSSVGSYYPGGIFW